ncbi:RluA family pseudouridine synthase [Acidaminobacter hydrogenoformans]|uniref:Pseudouridine synthase n=1 Tax=Acidaminobacter hydrogenoformans DSM 2784 TaxID=1120920 RepID=A0A1G5RT03_9FIRM|nr:RluA family pseudouridine synthase [Acidaminobacter hydrogenoformans]SCZ77245.1 23S rRNA pseudouridine1911/1915/1917 synthase [Acidaminobacter hydrogenoformans DSM 2784]
MFEHLGHDRLDFRVEPAQAGLKVIDVMVQWMDLSVRQVKNGKNRKAVLLNGRPVSVNGFVRAGDLLTYSMEIEENYFEPEEIPISVVFENEDLVLINKQPFVVVHPTKSYPAGTIGNGLAMRFKKKGINPKIRFINRLDRDTSGLLLIAKNPYAQHVVTEQMKRDEVEKRYLALVHGDLKADEGTIDAPIGRPDEERVERMVMAAGQPSTTHYWVRERFGSATLVEVRLETGRTHQIRVHFNHLGHPLVGDTLYHEASEGIDRQALHAFKLCFRLPRTKEYRCFEAPLPEDFERLLSGLRSKSSIRI